jgi:hypothetical protein
MQLPIPPMQGDATGGMPVPPDQDSGMPTQPQAGPIVPGPIPGPPELPPPNQMPKQVYAHPKMRPAGKAPFSKSSVRHDGRNFSASAKPPRSIASAHSQRHVVKGPG